jgi:hypothetical protein
MPGYTGQVTVDELQQLLAFPETTWIDWKREFPEGLLGGKQHAKWESGRGEVLKDLASIANGRDANDVGYLVYGVRDDGIARSIVGISKSFDDAMFQVWAENTFDPPPTFVYAQLQLQSHSIGVFTIRRVASYPHVVARDVGGIIYTGQVWFRRGTKNTIALAADLRRMCLGDQPLHFPAESREPLRSIIAGLHSGDWEPVLPYAYEKNARVTIGYEVVYYPGTRQEIWLGSTDRPQILMRRKRGT